MAASIARKVPGRPTAIGTAKPGKITAPRIGRTGNDCVLVKGFTYPFIPAASSASGVFTYGARHSFYSESQGITSSAVQLFATIQLTPIGLRLLDPRAAPP